MGFCSQITHSVLEMESDPAEQRKESGCQQTVSLMSQHAALRCLFAFHPPGVSVRTHNSPSSDIHHLLPEPFGFFLSAALETGSQGYVSDPALTDWSLCEKSGNQTGSSSKIP